MNKRARKRLNRAKFTAYTPNNVAGALQYVPAGVQQSTYGQTFYGNTLANLPVGQTALFSPGTPLPTQAGVNALGLPVQFRYPVAYNSFPVDRTLQREDIPSFEQLRRLAQMDYGIGICERYILRMVEKLKLKISLTDEARAGGAEEKDYKNEIKFFRKWFSQPDATNNLSIHEWIQAALIEQTQIDELYVYRNRTRGGRLLSLELVDGSQMKPLLDDWGRLPEKPRYAYQQYPWGIPGWQYTSDHIIHRRETPAVDTPYGRSVVERILFVTNLALKKIAQDMAYFKRNVPAGILMPPESSNWTPDQLDAYQQSFDAMLAGNLDLLSSIRVVQPGFTYTPFAQPSLDGVIDRFWLNIRASAYNIPMDSLGFTETSNRSTGQMQKDVLYEQTIGPFVAVYEAIFTDSMQNDFEPSLHGDLFHIEFGGYEPPEDEQAKATTLTTYTNAGILGLSAAEKLAGLPVDPDAPQIGRVYMSKDGPIFLDDMATDQMRQAASQARLAGFQMAANPPEPTDNTLPNTGQKEDKDESGAPKNAKNGTQPQSNSNGGHQQPATDGKKSRSLSDASEGAYPSADVHADFRRWRQRAIEDVKAGRQQRTFESDVIPDDIHSFIAEKLNLCLTPENVRVVFERAREGDTSFFREAVTVSRSGGNQPQSRSTWKLRW